MNKQATYSRSCGLVVAVLAVLAASVYALAAAPAPAPPDPGALLDGWSRVQLRASKLIASATAVIERWPAGEGVDSRLVRVSNELRYLGRSRLLVTYSERPAGGGLPLRWMEIDPGKKAREWRTAEGKLSKNWFGLPEGREPPWDGAWVAGRRLEIPFELKDTTSKCEGPHDAWSFFTALGCVAKSDETRIHLFTNDGLLETVARRVGARRVRVRVRDLDVPGSKATAREIEAAAIELLPAPGGPDPSVFGMEGGVLILVDPASGAPLQIEGRRDGIPGIIRFEIEGASTVPRPRPAVPWPGSARRATDAP